MANNRIDKINVGGADYDLGSTNFVFDTYAEYRAAYSAGDIPVGSVVYIKEGSTDNTITALQVVYNNGTVKSALDKLNNDLNDKIVTENVNVQLNGGTATQYGEKDITKTNYKAIGVVGIEQHHSNTFVVSYLFVSFDGNTLKYNFHDSSAIPTGTNILVKILYTKN